MIVNVGSIDRTLRALAGAALLYFAFWSGAAAFDAGALKWLAAGVGVVMIATAAMKFCPLYRIIGLKTCKAA